METTKLVNCSHHLSADTNSLTQSCGSFKSTPVKISLSANHLGSRGHLADGFQTTTIPILFVRSCTRVESIIRLSCAKIFIYTGVNNSATLHKINKDLINYHSNESHFGHSLFHYCKLKTILLILVWDTHHHMA